MSINVLDVLKDQVSVQLAKQASDFLGESDASVTSALGSIMPALLGSVVQKSTTTGGAQGVLDLIGTLDLESLGDIPGLFEGGASNVNRLLNSGEGIVELLLGSKTKDVVDLISNLSGLKNSAISTLLKLAAPFLLSVIGKQIQGKGLSFFTDLMMGQKSFVNQALPVGLESLFNFADFSGTPNVNTNIKTPTSQNGENNWMKWILPILLGVAVLYWLGTKGCVKKTIETSDTISSEIDSVAIKATEDAEIAIDSMNSAIKKLFQYKLPTGFEMVGAANDGIESKIITFIEDKSKEVDKTTWFEFDRLLFDINKATLQPESQEQLHNIAQILSAFPTVKLKIGGYTDNTGDPKVNQRLSTDRAFNVMNELVKLGIDKSRLSAEGYGDKFPVADNSSEEGRQQNRRISVRVTEK